MEPLPSNRTLLLDFVTYCMGELLSNERALSYLVTERGMTMATIKDALVGYCPPYAKLDKRLPREFEKLKGRITVPVFTEFDRLVGVAGRIPDKKVKGWWNTIFPKSSHLYGFNLARKSIFEANKVYVFEGYFDRLILAQFGLVNSVAVMSSALGMRRIGLLARYCEKICLCFDTDANEAGKLGLLKTLSELYMVGFGEGAFGHGDQDICRGVTMVNLPVGIDPDEYVMKEGLEGFLACEKQISMRQMELAGIAFEDLKNKMRAKQRREAA